MLFLASAFFTAGLAAYAVGTQNNLWPFFGAAVVFGTVFLVLDRRAVRSRIPWLRTFAMDLRLLEAETRTLIGDVTTLRQPGKEEPWDPVWKTRFMKYDREFWQVMKRGLPELAPVYERDATAFEENYPENNIWPESVRNILDSRLALVKAHLDEELSRRQES